MRINRRTYGAVAPVQKVAKAQAVKVCAPDQHQWLQDRSEPGREYCVKCGMTKGD
jgi:hypothetical protein